MNAVMRISAALILLLVAGCSQPAGPDAPELLVAYEAALQRTESAAISFADDPAGEAVVLERLEQFFSDMTPASVQAQTTKVYAADGWLFDNLAVVEGEPAIQAYFSKAAGEVDALRIEFLQVARADADYFVRWRMVIQAAKLADEPIVSYGMTQFRFDAEGRVLIHRDFWDAATGIYEYLPGVGGWLQRLRLTLGAAPAESEDNG